MAKPTSFQIPKWAVTGDSSFLKEIAKEIAAPACPIQALYFNYVELIKSLRALKEELECLVVPYDEWNDLYDYITAKTPFIMTDVGAWAGKIAIMGVPVLVDDDYYQLPPTDWNMHVPYESVDKSILKNFDTVFLHKSKIMVDIAGAPGDTSAVVVIEKNPGLQVYSVKIQPKQPVTVNQLHTLEQHVLDKISGAMHGKA